MKFRNKNRAARCSKTLLCGVLLAVVTSCSSDDYISIYNPDGSQSQNPGLFTVNLTGSTITDSNAKTTLALTVDGSKIYDVMPSVPTDIEAGTYNVTATKLPSASKLPEGTSINIAGLITLSASTDNELPLLPVFEAAKDEIGVVYNKSVTKNMVLKLMTRRLIVKGTLLGVDPATIKSVDVTLNGVSNARRINDGVVTKSIASRADNAAATSYYVTNATQPASDGTFSTSFNLLGINPEVDQVLHIIVTFNNGKTFTYEENVSTLLAGFNTASYETSVGLDATINFGIGGVSGTIIDWIPGWNEGGMGE
jgi:hypothetical protein